MRAFLVQSDIVWRDKEANFANVKAMLGSTVKPGSLVVLPEMFATGFDVELEALAEGDPMLEPGPTALFLKELAQQLHCTVQGSLIVSGERGQRRNIVAVFGNPSFTSEGARCLGTYTKMHPFRFGGEHKRFASGHSIWTYPCEDFTIAPFLCYDLRFPEAFRHAVLAGATICTVPSSWPSPRHAHWLPLLQARAIENQCYVLGVNRCGSDRFLQYQGESVAFGPRGELLAKADGNQQVLEVDLDLAKVRDWRAEFPALQDIRSELIGFKANNI